MENALQSRWRRKLEGSSEGMWVTDRERGTLRGGSGGSGSCARVCKNEWGRDGWQLEQNIKYDGQAHLWNIIPQSWHLTRYGRDVKRLAGWKAGMVIVNDGFRRPPVGTPVWLETHGRPYTWRWYIIVIIEYGLVYDHCLFCVCCIGYTVLVVVHCLLSAS